MARSFSVMVAPNGARRRRSDHPSLPETTEQLAATAQECYRAGAGAIHLHVRDAEGHHSLDPGRYRDAIAAISTSAPDMQIQVTTEAAGLYDVPAQYACLQQVQPKSASVSIREMARDIATAQRLYGFAAEAGIALQHILYSPQDVARLRLWVQQQIVPDTPVSVIFVLGQYAPPVVAQPDFLAPFLQAAKGMDLNWSICAFGHNEQACVSAALQQGGNVRVGFENNTQLPDGTPAPDNTALVNLAVQEGLSLGLSPLSPRKVA